MNTETNYWDIAEKDFSLILAKENIETINLFSAVLTSVFLVFRNEQKRGIKSFCEESLASLEKEGKNDSNDYYVDSGIRFSIRSTFIGEPETDYRINQKKEENEKIISDILQGNQKTFNEIYEYEFPKVVRYVKMNSGDVDQAKDIFQDAIVILVEKVQRNELDLTCSIKTYLFSISQHLWMDQLRQNKREIPLNDSYSYLNAAITVVGFENTPDIYEHVNSAIETLGNPCKQLLEYYYYKNLSWDEIASSLGYASAASARNQKYKCLERIRKTLNVEVD